MASDLGKVALAAVRRMTLVVLTDTIETFAFGLVARPDGYSEFHQVASKEYAHSGGYEIQGRIASINRAGYSSPTIRR